MWLRSRSTGTLVAREPEFTLFLRDSRTAAVRPFASRGGRIALPVGQYWLEGWRARMRDARGRAWEIASAPGEPARIVEVRHGRVTRLPLAAPVELALVIEQSGSEVSFRLRLKGAGGETCGVVRVDGRPAPPPSLRIEDAHGRVVSRLRFEDTCGAGCAQIWRAPAGLPQPLQATPEADLGPFPFPLSVFRFHLDEHPSAPEVPAGDPAPDFTLPPVAGGAPIRLSSLRGRPVVLGFFCGCGFCQAAARRLGPEAARRGATMLAIMENEQQLQPEHVARFRAVTGFRGPILADRGGAVTRRYRSLQCPRIWVVDARGRVRYTSPDPHTPSGVMARGIRAAMASGG
jgi:peroxiredoxin